LLTSKQAKKEVPHININLTALPFITSYMQNESESYIMIIQYWAMQHGFG